MRKLKSVLIKLIYERNMLSLAGNLSYAFFGFLSFMLLTRSLSQQDFGLYIIYVTTGTFIDLFRFGLTRNALIRFLSGQNGKDQIPWLGANSLIGVILVLAFSLIIFLIWVVFPSAIGSSDFKFFFYFYPLLAISNLFWNNALSVLQAWQAFGRILLLRLVNIVSFVLFLLVNIIWFHFDVTTIIWANIGSNVLSSLLSLVKKWDGALYTFKTTKIEILKIINYGKFSLGTMLGSSLLRSADTFLLGLAPFFGAVGVAQYVIPLKLTELLEIPLRSFMATAFPKLSKASLQNNMKEWKDVFYTYGGAISLLFIPFTILLFIFAEPIILLLGGDQYRESMDLLVLIFRVFTVYGLILPLDRISGVALDSINLPDKNLWKVVFMALSNIAGDLVAIYVFHSIFWVAMATVLNTLVGLFMGYYFLGLKFKIEYNLFVTKGLAFYKAMFYKGLNQFN
jgi:O-antigen/teichoic acid export membrane protein